MFGKEQMAELMRKAQKMQGSLKDAQESITRLEIQGESGAGLVKITITGKHDVKKLTIDPSLLNDKEILEDLIIASFNDANRKLEEEIASKYGDLTSNFPMNAINHF